MVIWALEGCYKKVPFQLQFLIPIYGDIIYFQKIPRNDREEIEVSKIFYAYAAFEGDKLEPTSIRQEKSDVEWLIKPALNIVPVPELHPKQKYTVKKIKIEAVDA
jgi:hypothetical protein